MPATVSNNQAPINSKRTTEPIEEASILSISFNQIKIKDMIKEELDNVIETMRKEHNNLIESMRKEHGNQMKEIQNENKKKICSLEANNYIHQLAHFIHLFRLKIVENINLKEDERFKNWDEIIEN